jgi:hypothetical protein
MLHRLSHPSTIVANRTIRLEEHLSPGVSAAQDAVLHGSSARARQVGAAKVRLAAADSVAVVTPGSSARKVDTSAHQESVAFAPIALKPIAVAPIEIPALN